MSSALDLGGVPTRRGRGPLALVLALLLLAALAAGGWWWWSNRDPGPLPAAEAFVTAWNAGDPATGPVAGTPAGVRQRHEDLLVGLGLDAPQVTLTAVSEPVEDSATADLTLRWDLGGDRDWTYDTQADLVRGEDGWLVEFSPAVVHPELTEDLRLTTRRTRPERADVMAADGTPIVTDRGVVEVGVQPSRVEDVDALVDDLRDLLDITADDLADRIEAANEDAFVPVLTLRDAAYAEVEDDLFPLPGTVFRRDEVPLAPTAEFARALLGRAGPVTAELVEEHPQRYAAGDFVGLSGLQRRYDEQLFGLPGLQVVAVPTDDAPDDTEEVVLHDVAAVDGTSVTLTLDERVQRAADATLAGETDHPSALVAIRISDGHVLAVANGPGTGGLDIATQGQYAPGSTFKVVTTAALLADGLDPNATVDCEGEAVVDGRRFTNAEDGARGQIPFREAFAESCNTTFVGLAGDLATDALATAAGWFGLGGDRTLGIGAYTGSVPENEAGTDQAAAAIGQARNLASPLAMADVAATVARGAHRSPALVVDPDPQDPADEQALPDEVAATLQDLMREVVTDGSGSALATVPGDPVHGKTGTAEYGDETPPRTHAWFIGYQGDLAFAVLVAETEDSFGGRVAAPLAADFLTRLAG